MNLFEFFLSQTDFNKKKNLVQEIGGGKIILNGEKVKAFSNPEVKDGDTIYFRGYPSQNWKVVEGIRLFDWEKEYNLSKDEFHSLSLSIRQKTKEVPQIFSVFLSSGEEKKILLSAMKVYRPIINSDDDFSEEDRLKFNQHKINLASKALGIDAKDIVEVDCLLSEDSVYDFFVETTFAAEQQTYSLSEITVI